MRPHPRLRAEARLSAQGETFALTVDAFMTSVTTFPFRDGFTAARGVRRPSARAT